MFRYSITAIGTDPGGTKFIKNFVRYPINCSFTGYSIKTGKVIIYTEGEKKFEEGKEKKEIEYIQEIDNLVLENSVKSAIYGPIIDKEGNIQGALQIVNMINNNEYFTEECYPEFESLREVLGSAVHQANKVDNVMNMNWKMLGVMDKMDEMMVEGDTFLANSSKNLEQYLIKAKGNFLKMIFVIDDSNMKKLLEKKKNNVYRIKSKSPKKRKDIDSLSFSNY